MLTRCKDSHTTYFEGISTPPDDKYSKKEVAEIEKNYAEEQKQLFAKRQAEKFGRLAKFSLDDENKQNYRRKESVWNRVRAKTGDLNTAEYVEQKRLSNIREKLNITQQWMKSTGDRNGKVVNLTKYSINGVEYQVDDKYVVLRPNQNEIHVAEVLSKEYGKQVDMVPQIIKPEGIATPDYLIDGERFDLKSPTGSGKNVLYGMVSKNRRQSSNFIYDLTKCPLEIDEVERQIDGIYSSSHTLFVDKIILFKNDKVLKVYRRKK